MVCRPSSARRPLVSCLLRLYSRTAFRMISAFRRPNNAASGSPKPPVRMIGLLGACGPHPVRMSTTRWKPDELRRVGSANAFEYRQSWRSALCAVRMERSCRPACPCVSPGNWNGPSDNLLVSLAAVGVRRKQLSQKSPYLGLSELASRFRGLCPLAKLLPLRSHHSELLVPRGAVMRNLHRPCGSPRTG